MNTTQTADDMYQDGRYLENNASWHTEGSPFKARQIKTILDRNHLQPATFVEVGCGAGAILTELAAQLPSAKFDGYDVSPQASALNQARESERIQFHHEDFLQTHSHFDALLLMDVFEHVPDYMGFLRSLASRADYAIFHIPLEINVASIFRGTMLESRRTVGHLHYFNRETALATLRDCGYDVIDEFYTEFFRDFERPSWKNKLTGIIYNITFSISKHLAVKLFGDCSLIVLAKPQRA